MTDLAHSLFRCRHRHGIAVRGRLVLAVLALGLSACAPLARYEAAGMLAGQPIATRVDSREAVLYLERERSGEPGDPGLAAEVVATLERIDPAPTDREGLARLARASSTDLATMHFVSELYTAPENRRLQDRYLALVDRLKNEPPAEITVELERYRDYKIVFVPGYAYRSNPANGADFRLQRALLTELGFEPELIETEEYGTVEDNARIVARALAELAAQHDSIVLVSTSKGGPEAAVALAALRGTPAQASIEAWISVGGLLRGSPYADRYLSWPKRPIALFMLERRGQPPGMLENLSTVARRPAFEVLTLPPDLLMLQFVGVPLSGHVRDDTLDRYRVMRRLGPNDGLTLLADELIEGGIVVTEIGLDHYFRAPDIDIRTVALTYAVLDELERRAAEAAPQSSRLCARGDGSVAASR